MSLLRLLQVLPWIGFILVLYFSDSMRYYVVDWQVEILLGAVVATIGLVGWAALNGLRGSATAMPVGEVLVQLVPLYIFASIGPTVMDAAQLDPQRLYLPELTATETTGGGESGDAGSEGSEGGEGQAAADPRRIPVQQYVHVSNAIDLGDRSLLDCYEPERNAGDRLIVIGRLLGPATGAELRSMPGMSGVDAWLYRHVIVCCAADARAVVVGLRGELPTGLAPDDWVRVEGILKPRAAGHALPVLQVEAAAAWEMPDDPYLVAPED